MNSYNKCMLYIKKTRRGSQATWHEDKYDRFHELDVESSSDINRINPNSLPELMKILDVLFQTITLEIFGNLHLIGS